MNKLLLITLLQVTAAQTLHAEIDMDKAGGRIPLAAAVTAQAAALAAPCSLRGPAWVADLAKAYEATAVESGGPNVTPADVDLLKRFAASKLAEAQGIMAKQIDTKGTTALCRGYNDSFAFAAADSLVTDWRVKRDQSK